MLSLDSLWWLLAAGALAFAGCVIALVTLRLYVDWRRHAVEGGVVTLEPVLHEWLVQGGDDTAVVLTLRRLPSYAAFRSLARLATQLLPLERQQHLAHALRHEPWVQAILARSRSWLWWRRFDAARLYSIVGTEDDAAAIARLLEDPSAAVRLVAIDAAARLSGRPLLDRELETLPLRQEAVQAYQFAAMTRHAPLVASALATRLNASAPEAALSPWIDAAGALASVEALRPVRALGRHPSPIVRLHVARALRRFPDPETPPVLLALLADADWRVRAQAARALGALRCAAAVEALSHAVRDRSWWVRYRSALALAQIGGPGRAALTALTACEDPMARDMSTLVAGLSSAGVVEMSEV